MEGKWTRREEVKGDGGGEQSDGGKKDPEG
jgi:hypothetical protein